MAPADDELCQHCHADLSEADDFGRRLHAHTCTDKPPKGSLPPRWTLDRRSTPKKITCPICQKDIPADVFAGHLRDKHGRRK